MRPFYPRSVPRSSLWLRLSCAAFGTKSNTIGRKLLQGSRASCRHTILRSNETTMSYELPHFLRRWETTIRQFCAVLPESQSPPDEQQVFWDLFIEYIDTSDETVSYAQSFHVYILDTIRHYIGDTKSLTEKLDRIGFSQSNTMILLDRSLAQSMGWLNAHYMVYLPVGIEPFKRPYGYVAEMGALELLKSHVSSMSNRVYIDIDMITVL